MNTILFVIAIFVGMVAMIVLTALLRGAVGYLNSRRRALSSNRRKQRLSMRNQTAGS
jgi:hypothetical protein